MLWTIRRGHGYTVWDELDQKAQIAAKGQQGEKPLHLWPLQKGIDKARRGADFKPSGKPAPKRMAWAGFNQRQSAQKSTDE